MPASRNYASKDTTSRHLLTFVRLALQPKVPITSSMLQKFKMQMPDILLLTRIGSLPKKKRKEDSPYYNFCHVPYARESWFSTLWHNSSDTICYKTIILGSPNDSHVLGKKGKLLFTITIHLSLFTRHYSLVLFTVTVHSEILPI